MAKYPTLIVPQDWQPGGDYYPEQARDTTVDPSTIAQKAAPSLGIDAKPLDLAQKVAPSLGIDLTAHPVTDTTPVRGVDVAPEGKHVTPDFSEAGPKASEQRPAPVNPMVSQAPGELKTAVELKAQRLRTIKGEGSVGDVFSTAGQVGMQPALTAASMAAGILSIPQELIQSGQDVQNLPSRVESDTGEVSYPSSDAFRRLTDASINTAATLAGARSFGAPERGTLSVGAGPIKGEPAAVPPDPAHELAAKAASQLGLPPPEVPTGATAAPEIKKPAQAVAEIKAQLQEGTYREKWVRDVVAGKMSPKDLSSIPRKPGYSGPSIEEVVASTRRTVPVEGGPPTAPPRTPTPPPAEPPPGGFIPPSKGIAKATVTEMEDDLHRLKSNEQADQSELRNYVKSLPADVKARDEELYHVGENRPLQQSDPHFQQYGAPIAREEKVLIDRLRTLTGDKELAYDPEYMHRQVQGATPRMDEAIGMDEAIPYKGQRRTTSTETSSTQHRSIFAIEDEAGNRKVVTQAPDGGVIVWEGGKPFRAGSVEALRPGTEFVDVNGKVQQVKQAKTAEIEAHTNLAYHKSFFGSKLTNVADLRKAVRNAEFLDKWRNSDAFKQFSVPTGEAARPAKAAEQAARDKGWVSVDAPGWRNRLYDPRFAEPLNDFYKGIAPATSMLGKTLERLNRIAVGSLFWTGIGSLAHVRNVMGMRFMARGFGNINPARFSVAARAFREIQQQGPLYIEALRDGASMPSADPRFQRDSLEGHILKTLGHEITSADPAGLAQAAKKLGMTAKDYAVGFEKGIAHAVFKYGDYLMMQHIVQQMDKGMSLREARLDAEKFLATYRLPSRTGGSGKLARMTTEMLGGPNKLMFGRFERAKARFWYNLVADSLKTLNPTARGFTLQQRMDTVGRVTATVALIALIGPAVINPILQSITKDKNAHVNLGGAAGWMQSALKAADQIKSGRESAGHALFEFFNGLNNIAPVMKEFMQQVSGWRGLDWFTGQPITEGGANTPLLRYMRERAEHATKTMLQPANLLSDPSRMIREPFGISTAKPFSDQPRSRSGGARQFREDRKIRGKLYGGTQ